MIAMIKKPKLVEEIVKLKDKNALYNCVCYNSIPEFVLFDEKRKIGMFVTDDGCYSGLPRNFIHENHIIYGNVVFVGLNNEGKAINLTKSQTAFIQAYLNHNSLSN